MACPPPPLSGRRVVAAGLICGAGGLVISVFLRAVVDHTPVEVHHYTLHWFTLVLGAFGAVAGMAVESVRQLQASNPDPEYHHKLQAQQLQRRRSRRRQL